MDPTTRSLDELLQHERFVQRLARSLLGTSDDADDLVQETWLRAVQHPPDSSGQALGWLGTVMRNLARDWRVGAVARARREAAAARSEATPPLKLAIEREEMRRQILQALGHLPEAHASAIVLRFFDGLPPREIARRLSVPVETLRKRLTRGLAELREELDGTFEGGRAGWTAALPVLVGVPAVSSASAGTATLPALLGALLMSTTAKVLCVLAILSVGTVVVTHALSRPDSPQSPVQTRVVPASATGDSPATAAAKPDTAQSRSLKPRSFVESEDAEIPAAVAEGSAFVRGRCVDESGAPLADCAVRLEGDPQSSDTLNAHESVHGKVVWKNPTEAKTSPDGRFEFRFTPPAPYRFFLWIIAPERVETMVRWLRLDPLAAIDLGDIVLPRGARIRGRVVDEGSLPQPGVEVHLLRGGRVARGEPEPRSSFQFAAGPNGVFMESAALASGRYAVSVKGLAELIEPKSVDVAVSAAELTIEVKVRVPSADDLVTGLVVDDQGSPVARADIHWDPSGGGVRWLVETEPDGTFRLQRQSDDSKAPLTITASREGFEAARTIERVPWGTKDLKLVMRRGFSVEIGVRDGDEDRPLQRYGVRCDSETATGLHGPRGSVRDRGSHEGGVLRLSGICRGRQALVIEPEGPEWMSSAPTVFQVTDAGAPRQDVTVWRAVSNTIRVRTDAGIPLVGSKIEILANSGVRPVTPRTFVLPRGMASSGFLPVTRVADGTTGADGTVVLRAPAKSNLVLRALGPGHSPVVQDVRFEREAAEIEVIVSKGAALHGTIAPADILEQMRLSRLDDVPPSRARDGNYDPGVWLQKPGEPSERHPVGMQAAGIGADGAFIVDGVPAGTWQVVLQTWQADAAGRGASVRSVGSSRRVIGWVALADGEEKREAFDLSSLRRGTIEGRITLDGKPLEDVWVGLDAQTAEDHKTGAGESVQGIQTDAEGRFTASAWPATYRLLIQTTFEGKQLLSHDADTFTLGPGQRLARTFELRTSVLELKVVGSDGSTPIQGVRLDIEIPAPAWPVGTEFTDAGGKVQVRGLQAGEVVVSVLPKRLRTAEAVQEFRQSGKGSLDQERIRVTTLKITPPQTVATIRLPSESGY